MSARPWHTPLCSLVVTLSGKADLAASAEAWIRSHPGLTVGDRVGQYLPVVLEDADARPIHSWLEALPGVANVDVTFCAFEPEPLSTNP